MDGGLNLNIKKIVGEKIAEEVKDGDVVGIGSGSTVAEFIKALGKRIREEGITVYGIPTSYQSKILSVNHGIKVVSLLEYPSPELAVDGADQVSADLSLIKGHGGAHTMEKIVAISAGEFKVIVDESKLSDILNTFVPVEVIPEAVIRVMEEIRLIGGEPWIREAEKKVGPVVTDNGNLIIDIDFGTIREPEKLNISLNSIPGVVESGIFPSHMVTAVYVAKSSGNVEVIRR